LNITQTLLSFAAFPKYHAIRNLIEAKYNKNGVRILKWSLIVALTNINNQAALKNVQNSVATLYKKEF
jgi:hypothetical protein